MRLVDLTAAVLLLVFAGWLMILIAGYVRLGSRGGAIFTQPRVGRFGRTFICYKFRTMTIGTAHIATHEAPALAITRAGRFLCRTKLDELPQGYVIKEYFANYFLHMSDVTFDMRNNRMHVYKQRVEPWTVTLVDTGDDSTTGGRLKRVADHVRDEREFLLTYGDGVGDIDVSRSIEISS